LVVAAYRNRQLRRAVAILWDVVTFWPRANHPLTPPSYGARTVWDVRLRLAALMEMADPTRVVLVAHSQGTVIAAATLLQASTEREHYPLLTFGSPLRRLYAQNFPAYFGTEALGRLRIWQEANQQWINLWARTDPIGAWIFDDQNTDLQTAQTTDVDCRLLDVQPKDGPSGLVPDPGAPICGHSGFWTRQEYTAAVDALQSTVIPEDSAPPDSRATAPPTEELL
jgi:pimeloyl-ACP methyl ester carboxylesterase